ncbi:MAG: single-stranded DNA-binding protein [Candidatus Campbellbacteria bacterium]|nr:single-stranded DNA-binding protein [Candidatus Campbellbacteria bacterium]
MYINKALLYGNLTRDPELKSLPSGSSVSTFSIATNRVWKDKEGNKQESTDFHNIVVFGKQAETVSQYLRKGSSAFVEGRMVTRSWDAQDGSKKYRTEVIADRVQFGPRSGGSSTEGKSFAGPQDKGNAQQQNAPAIDTIQYPDAQDEGINPEDIPF